MNYHFKAGGRKDQLLQQLQQLDNDIKGDANALEKLRLDAEFYQDKIKPLPVDKQSLADEIMKELINDPYKARYDPPRRASNQLPPYNSPPKEIAAQPAVRQQPQAERQNNLMNERQLQKVKLQNQKHEGLFPTSSDHNRVRSYGKQPLPIVPEQDRGTLPPNYGKFSPTSPKKVSSPDYEPRFDPAYNPFVKDDTLQKQRKEERNREYLRELEEQRLEQERKKKEQVKEERDRKVEVYDGFKPAVKQPQVVAEKAVGMRKSDPNSRPPKVEPMMGNFSQFDKNLIRSKVIELKSKYKKGKIIYEEYERELNNFRKQYPGDLDEVEEQGSYNNYSKKENSPVRENLQPSRGDQEPKLQSRQKLDQPKNQPTNFPIRNQSINYSQFAPSMVQQSYPLSNPYPQSQNASVPMPVGYGMVPPSYFQGAPPAQYIELLKKMFDFCFKEVREVRSEQSAQNQVLHQTLNKFLAINTLQPNQPQQPNLPQQPSLLTQQIAPIPQQLQRDFYSDAKQHREYFQKESSMKRKPGPSNESLANIPFGESDNSEYYDRSLSGIASKIPLNQRVNTREDERTDKIDKVGKLSALDQFYNRKYKVKPLKKFNILVDATQSETEIPSTSSYLRAKNVKEELKMRFQEDLNQLKKVQREKSVRKLAGKMAGNVEYSDKRERKDPSFNLVGVGQIYEQVSSISKQGLGNPFLKKYQSTEDKMLTFNQKQMRINSPPGYSPLSKKEILEQDEYQTEPRVREQQGVASLIQEYQQRLAQPSKALNFIKLNNQVLSKYDRSEQSKRDYISIKDSQAKGSNYFINNQISPVKPPDHYEQSLQTIRSDFQSVKKSARPAKVSGLSPAKMGLSPAKGQSPFRGHSPGKGLSPAKAGDQPRQSFNGEMRYSQTVESVQQSSSKLRKPPIAKRKSVGKKKESSISRSKSPHESALGVSGQSGESVHEYPKFDSNIYDSAYEESVEAGVGRRPVPQIVVEREESEGRGQEIQIGVPTIVTPKGTAAFDLQPGEEIRGPSAKQMNQQGKWKSLEEARKMARECRVKVTDESKDYRSVEEKFSQLESFVTKRGDESQHLSKLNGGEMVRQKAYPRQGAVSGRTDGKSERRNILKMLESLEDEEYRQQFQSYREESQQYQ